MVEVNDIGEARVGQCGGNHNPESREAGRLWHHSAERGTESKETDETPSVNRIRTTHVYLTGAPFRDFSPMGGAADFSLMSLGVGGSYCARFNCGKASGFEFLRTGSRTWSVQAV